MCRLHKNDIGLLVGRMVDWSISALVGWLVRSAFAFRHLPGEFASLPLTYTRRIFLILGIHPARQKERNREREKETNKERKKQRKKEREKERMKERQKGKKRKTESDRQMILPGP